MNTEHIGHIAKTILRTIQAKEQGEGKAEVAPSPTNYSLTCEPIYKLYRTEIP
jgi:hypothetical protein